MEVGRYAILDEGNVLHEGLEGRFCKVDTDDLVKLAFIALVHPIDERVSMSVTVIIRAVIINNFEDREASIGNIN